MRRSTRHRAEVRKPNFDIASLGPNVELRHVVGDQQALSGRLTGLTGWDVARIAKGFPGLVRLMTKKLGADSENIYMRRKGEPAFKLIFAKRVSFPVDDDTPPATPGQAEQREYQFRGVIGDDEIGQPSDIVQATFTP